MYISQPMINVDSIKEIIITIHFFINKISQTQLIAKPLMKIKTKVLVIYQTNK